MAFSKSEWRLIHTPAANGAWNMAVDEAILESASNGRVKPTLRLYSWSPPCLSLGYAQPVADVDRGRLENYGWDLVRRPTGGKAILHTDELTYAVIAPLSEPRLAGGVLESYQRLSAALIGAMTSLGLSVQALEKTPSENQQATANPVCFETPSNYEITIARKKIIGSAQARRREGVLQHGSFPLTGDLTRITSALYFPDGSQRAQAAERLLQRATTAEAILGYPLDWSTAAQAFADAFRQTLNLQLAPENLSEAEQKRAAQLVREKYNHPEWTDRV
jgi:lipoate-protein ligase A